MSIIKNLTPHEIVIVGDNGAELLRVPPSGQVARVSTTRAASKPLEANCGGGTVTVPVTTSVTGDVVGLPAPEAGVAIIVSAMVRAAVGSSRPDVFSPGELVRGTNGQPIGCRGLEGSL